MYASGSLEKLREQGNYDQVSGPRPPQGGELLMLRHGTCFKLWCRGSWSCCLKEKRQDGRRSTANVSSEIRIA